MFISAPYALDKLCVCRQYKQKKNLLRSTNPATIAFASALLSGEGIEVFEMDVNMSILDGSLGILPRRLMVHDDDYDEAYVALADNEIDTGY